MQIFAIFQIIDDTDIIFCGYYRTKYRAATEADKLAAKTNQQFVVSSFYEGTPFSEGVTVYRTAWNLKEN